MRLGKVNLNTGTITTEIIANEGASKVMGGRGAATKIMLKMLNPHVSPLSGENVLVLATGPVTGTGAAVATE